MSNNLNRRRFLTLGGIAAVGSAAVVGLGQVWNPKFVRQCVSDVSDPILTASLEPTPGCWDENRITASWLGHATVLINFYGVNILTDPVLFDRVGADLGFVTLGPKRRISPALAAGSLPKIDLVLLSHAHLDHFDVPSLRTFTRETQVVTASRTSDLLEGTELKRAAELKWGEKTVIAADAGKVEVEAFEVKHWGARWRHDKHRGYNGYILRRGGKSIIFGGDTALCGGFAAIRSKGPFELACMPIGAYNPFIHSHCNPEQAVQMANDAGAKYILPIHHNTFRFGREASSEPLERLERAMQVEPERIALRSIGETFTVG